MNVSLKTLWFISIILIYYIFLVFILYRYSLNRLLLFSALFLAGSSLLHYYYGLMELRFIYYYPAFIFGVICAKHRDAFSLLGNRIFVALSLLIVIIITYIPEHYGYILYTPGIMGHHMLLVDTLLRPLIMIFLLASPFTALPH